MESPQVPVPRELDLSTKKKKKKKKKKRKGESCDGTGGLHTYFIDGVRCSTSVMYCIYSTLGK